MKKKLYFLFTIYVGIAFVCFNLYLLFVFASLLDGVMAKRAVDEKTVLGYSVQKVNGGKLIKLLKVGDEGENGPSHTGTVEVDNIEKYPIGSKVKFSYCKTVFSGNGTGSLVNTD
jgi:hypothetical protein